MALQVPVAVKDLIELGKSYPWPRLLQCPRCKSAQVWSHGYVTRYFEGYDMPVLVKRFRCPVCRAVHTCRPQGFVQALRYTAAVVLACLSCKLVHERWLSGINRQTQQYWYRQVRNVSSRVRTVMTPTIDHIHAFLSGRIPTAQCVPLRL